LSSFLSRRRLDPEFQARGPSSGNIATLFSLLLPGVVVVAVALFILRTSPAALESTAFVEPEGTSVAAPQIQAAPPRVVPTVAPDPSSAALNRHIQTIAVLPTVAAPLPQPTERAEPTPTPRAVVLPTVIPMTLPSPVATRPPLPLVSNQPINAFVTSGDLPPAMAAAPQLVAVATEPPARMTQPAVEGDVAPTHVSAANDNLERARALQTNRVRRGQDRTRQTTPRSPVSSPRADSPAWQAAPNSNLQSGPIAAVPNPSASLPDANAIRDDVAARINAPRP
jgi:hypothetical protein